MVPPLEKLDEATAEALSLLLLTELQRPERSTACACQPALRWWFGFVVWHLSPGSCRPSPPPNHQSKPPIKGKLIMDGWASFLFPQEGSIKNHPPRTEALLPQRPSLLQGFLCHLPLLEYHLSVGQTNHWKSGLGPSHGFKPIWRGRLGGRGTLRGWVWVWASNSPHMQVDSYHWHSSEAQESHDPAGLG